MSVVFNIQRFSIQDGPGIRTTVFIKGCPLRCLWCSNPESQNPFPEVGHRNSVCNKCGRCVAVCEEHAISVTAEGVRINRDTCTNCGRCVEVCLPRALETYGKETTAQEAFEEVVRDRSFYRNSGGGITVSGGEPLSQPSFVADLFGECRDAGITTCIETSGYAGPEAWKTVLPHTDLVLFDIKLLDPEYHLRMTGKNNDRILENLSLALSSGVPVIIRIPVIPGVNDSSETISEIAHFLSDKKQIKKVHLLPYHRFGTSKYLALDRTYGLDSLRPPEEGHLRKLNDIIESMNIGCEIIL
ncbi:MAG: glycyl-radical enzyme activating protein [Chloroflexi bacterium]|nr:glycyl-radical enzyme activating protein [Chloroflexota bacterium]